MSNFRQRRPDTITVTYGDHEVITPDNSKLRKTVQPVTPEEPEDKAVERAEEALSQISNEFAGWMNKECERLDAARGKVKASGLNKTSQKELFLAAHDVKGHSDTF